MSRRLSLFQAMLTCFCSLCIRRHDNTIGLVKRQVVECCLFHLQHYKCRLVADALTEHASVLVCKHLRWGLEAAAGCSKSAMPLRHPRLLLLGAAGMNRHIARPSI